MFWFDEVLKEEEWSLSAKLFAGLVFNPFSLVNAGEDSLFAWFWKRITGSVPSILAGWRAKPEYSGKLGRNDWRLHVDNWEIAVECKFGDGIDIYKDCLQYLDGLPPNYRRIVVVATVSEFSELTKSCKNDAEWAPVLIDELKNGSIVLIAWHEIVEAAIKCLPVEDAKLLRVWADKVTRNSLLLMPKKRVSGFQIASMILEGKVSKIPIVHKPDARGKRGSTATLQEVCIKRNAPNWVRHYLETVEQTCLKKNLVFESKHSGWVNIRKNKSHSVTLFPLNDGVAILISHPTDAQRFSDYSRLEELEIHNIVPDNKNWFPRDRTIGITFRGSKSCKKQHFVDEIIKVLDRL